MGGGSEHFGLVTNVMLRWADKPLNDLIVLSRCHMRVSASE